MNGTKKQNAMEMISAARTVAARLADSAEQYYGAMTSTPRPDVRVSKFYRTFDGSLVYVARRATQCRCPACTGQPMQILGMPVSVISLNNGHVQPVEIEQEQHQAADDEDPTFVAVVIRGGHGIKDIKGEEPGDPFIVDQHGWVTLHGAVDAASMSASVSGISLALAGLSLEREMTAAFSELAGTLA